jgi:predicted RNA-binding protein with PUA-like domain
MTDYNSTNWKYPVQKTATHNRWNSIIRENYCTRNKMKQVQGITIFDAIGQFK